RAAAVGLVRAVLGEEASEVRGLGGLVAGLGLQGRGQQHPEHDRNPVRDDFHSHPPPARGCERIPNITRLPRACHALATRFYSPPPPPPCLRRKAGTSRSNRPEPPEATFAFGVLR